MLGVFFIHESYLGLTKDMSSVAKILYLTVVKSQLCKKEMSCLVRDLLLQLSGKGIACMRG